MPRKSAQSIDLDFAFYTHLLQFYQQNRGRVRTHYRDLSKKFLDFNHPDNAFAYLRTPQYEALEIYIFLKEFLNNAPVHAIFQQWAEKSGPFTGRAATETQGLQLGLFTAPTIETYAPVFKRMQASARPYSNYIFALTMGTGKTILMATCIYYEFLLANKFPQHPAYCHNALVFAPDKTVLESLREIQTFDMAKVVPPEYVNFLTTHIQFHFLDETGATLDVLDQSRFNVIISNTQKIILKKQGQAQSPAARLFGSGPPTYQTGTPYAAAADLYAFDEPADEIALTTNQRFEKLRRLGQLGIYVDEAHHAFGSQLANDMGLKTTATSLRLTIDALAASLEKSGTHVVACYNYTGTPYVGQEVLPEVVYAYGLQDAIDHQYLKKVRINGYTNPHSAEFVQIVIDDFLHHTRDLRPEGMLPKLAFFAATIEELQTELRPAVEQALDRHQLPASTILVNVGDDRLTSNDDIRLFNRLDTPGSDKQFILLVGKGREGWNCRSLFGVALFRRPRSKIFVLQATMRCLRAIGPTQPTGHVYLSADNIAILDTELAENFRLSVDDLQGAGNGKTTYRVRVVPPPVTIHLHRIRRQYHLRPNPLPPTFPLNLDQVDTTPYRLLHTVQDTLVVKDSDPTGVRSEDLTHLRQRRTFTHLTLVAEIARYLNLPCLAISDLLDRTAEGPAALLAAVNQFNEILYDHIIPHLFNTLFHIDQEETTEEYPVELIKTPDHGYYEITAAPDLTITRADVDQRLAPKSFHLDPYCFDSQPERRLFLDLLRDHRIQKVYFTGMLTHGQTDFYIQYIDPESHTVRTYYPDFLFQKQDGTYVIVEVKRDDQILDPVVQAKKDFTEQLAAASGMTYQILKSSAAAAHHYAPLLNGGPHPTQPPIPQE